MNPIVSPALIYVINLLNVLHVLSVALSGLGICSFMAIYMLYSEKDISHSQYEKYMKLNVIVVCISAVFAILIPDIDTMYKMMVASYVTPDNISAVQSDVVQFIQQIVDVIKEVK